VWCCQTAPRSGPSGEARLQQLPAAAAAAAAAAAFSCNEVTCQAPNPIGTVPCRGMVWIESAAEQCMCFLSGFLTLQSQALHPPPGLGDSAS
jgi:hypothetical protein